MYVRSKRGYSPLYDVIDCWPQAGTIRTDCVVVTRDLLQVLACHDLIGNDHLLAVTVNGTRYNTSDSCTKGSIEVPHPTSGSPIQGNCARVEMAGGWHYRADIPTNEGETKHKVGPGRVFLLSDDRTFHDDSRDFGAIMADTCKETVFFRLWGKKGFGDAESRFTYIR